VRTSTLERLPCSLLPAATETCMTTLPEPISDDDDDGDDTPFHLPMLGLYADLEMGRGAVHLPDEFHAAPPAVRRQLLDDWLRGLQALRDALAVGGQAPPGAADEG
jgi:hypothetical protein